MLTRNDSEDFLQVREHVVSETWLRSVLIECYSKDRPNARVTVTSFDVTKGNDASESVLSDIVALTVHFNLDEESKTFDLIIKLLPLDPFSRYFVTEAEFDLREIKFYTEVVPDLEKFQAEYLGENSNAFRLPVPKCYLGKHVPFALAQTLSPVADKINESIIVMEDLKKLGYENVSFEKGLSLDQAKRALEAVSRLHALSLAMKVRENTPLFEKYKFLFQTEKASASYQQLMDRGLPQLTAFLEKRPNVADIVNCLNNIRPKTKHLIEVLLNPKEPICLITHTDFWSNNLLFDDDKCAILDWQMVTCSQPTNDLALLMISSLGTDIRRAESINLLDHYWFHLKGHTKKLSLDIEADLNYWRENLMADYKRSQLLALLLCIGSIDIALKNPAIEQRLMDVLVDLYEDGILSPQFVDENAEPLNAEAIGL